MYRKYDMQGRLISEEEIPEVMCRYYEAWANTPDGLKWRMRWTN